MSDDEADRGLAAAINAPSTLFHIDAGAYDIWRGNACVMPGSRRPLPRPGTEWRRRQLFWRTSVLTDSLVDAGLWPFDRWAGRIVFESGISLASIMAAIERIR